MEKPKNWSREETLAALYLYISLPSNMVDDTSKDVQALSGAIGRTTNSVAKKIRNLKYLDKRICADGKVGMSHTSKMDRMVWAEYFSAGAELVDEAKAAAETLLNHPGSRGLISDELKSVLTDDCPEGKEYKALVCKRSNQAILRKVLLANYNSRCCLTGLANEKLLVASHIKPWKVADRKTERLAPDNGLLLNALHDKAFDRGLITITKDYKIVVSSMIRHEAPEDEYLWRYNGETIALPNLFPPRAEFIEYHNDMVFKG